MSKRPTNPWVHGSRLGRDHDSVRRHLREDHHIPWEQIRRLTYAGVHGMHDGLHDKIWSYASDLPHPPLSYNPKGS